MTANNSSNSNNSSSSNHEPCGHSKLTGNLDIDRRCEDQDYLERGLRDEANFVAINKAIAAERKFQRRMQLSQLTDIINIISFLVILLMLCSGVWIGPLAELLRNWGII